MKSICGLVLLSACAGASVGGKDEGTGETGFTETGSGGGCDTPTTWYQDSDRDGFGDAVHAVSACEAPEGTVEDATDCDDTSAQTYPGAPEICNDGVSNDCDDLDGSAAYAACPSTGPFLISGGDTIYLGEGPGDMAGATVAAAGDVNGDGRNDLLIAAPDERSGGAAYVVLEAEPGTFTLGEASTVVSFPSDDYSGWWLQNSPLASSGDMDGDALPDIVVGYPALDDPDLGGAQIYSGLLLGAIGVDDAAATIYGVAMFADTGKAVAGAGDAEGDGWDDLLVGAPGLEVPGAESSAGLCGTEDDDYGSEVGGNAGAVYFVSGPLTGLPDLADSTAILVGEDTGDNAGAALAAAGDLNGDGIADMFVGASGQCAGGLQAGATYVVLGPASGAINLADADGEVIGEGMFSRFGETLSSAGDMNGDGTPDMLIGAPDLDGPSVPQQGAVWLILGPALGAMSVDDGEAHFQGDAGGFNAGRSLAASGDMDADGFDDVLIGAFLAGPDDSYPGAAYLIAGPASGTRTLGDDGMTFIGSDDDYAGWSVAGVGDTNADGRPDLLFGLPGDRTEKAGAGAAALILGGGPAFTGTWGP